MQWYIQSTDGKRISFGTEAWIDGKRGLQLTEPFGAKRLPLSNTEPEWAGVSPTQGLLTIAGKAYAVRISS